MLKMFFNLRFQIKLVLFLEFHSGNNNFSHTANNDIVTRNFTGISGLYKTTDKTACKYSQIYLKWTAG